MILYISFACSAWCRLEARRQLSIAGAQFGCAAWLEQHERLEQLNLQAHHNMHFHSDEFVMAALVASGNLPVLVHELLVSEVGPSVYTGTTARHCTSRT